MKKNNKEDGKCKHCGLGCEGCDARYILDYYIQYSETELVKLENVLFLVNDFNFFDLLADYTPKDGRTRKGKFKLSELVSKEKAI